MSVKGGSKRRAGSYQTVKNAIREKITRAVWRSGDRIPTVVQAARLFSVNSNTVLRALSELKREGFIDSHGRRGSFVSDRWQAAPMSQRPNPATESALDRLHAGVITRFHPKSGGSSFQPTILRLLASRLYAEGGRIENILVGSDFVQERIRLHRMIEEDRFNGLLLADPQDFADRELIQALARKRIPFVGFLGSMGLEFPADAVRIDDAWAFSHAVEHLAGLGHRRLAFAGLPLNQPVFSSWNQVRLDGFRKGLAQHGIKLSPDAIFGTVAIETPPPGSPTWVLEAGEYPLTDMDLHGYALGLRFPADRFTAAVCCNDNVAAGLAMGLRCRGLRVPEDVSVIGYDNIPDRALVVRELTTFTLPDQRIADTMLTLLLRHAAGNADFGDQVNCVLRPILVQRSSCCPSAAKA